MGDGLRSSIRDMPQGGGDDSMKKKKGRRGGGGGGGEKDDVAGETEAGGVDGTGGTW
jgi:hypothetical protein